MEKDMTTGSPFKLIFWFTIPLVIGNIFQQFYNMADAVIVGRFVGVNALAAVGMSGSIIFLILGFLNGMTTGFTVLTAHCFGAGDMDKMKQSVFSTAVLSVLLTVVLTVVSVMGLDGILHFMNTPDEIYAEAYGYMKIIYLGVGTQVLYNVLASILRALGNSKTPLYFLIFAAVLNIILDIVFIFVFHMGTKGAAAATVISQGASGILCLLYMIKYVPILRMEKKHRIMDFESVKFQIKVGLPMGLQFSITAVGIIILQSALNGFGAIAVAGFTASTKALQIINQVVVSIGVTMATYASQNMGAKKIDRIRKGARVATAMSVTYSLAVAFVLHFFGKNLVYLFVGKGEPEVLVYSQQYFDIFVPFLVVLGLIFSYRNILQGMGFGLVPMLAGVAELTVRTLTAFLAGKAGSYAGICWSDPFAWFSAAIPLILAYLWHMKRLEKQ